MRYSDVSVFSDGKKLNVGSYLTRSVIFDVKGARESFSLSIVSVHEDGYCDVNPYQNETPSTIQLDSPVIIRPRLYIDSI